MMHPAFRPKDAALEQMQAKGYAEKDRASGKQIVLIGIGVSSQEKNVTEFVWEAV